MKFIFIRHGESENNALHDVLREDPNMNEAKTSELFYQTRKHDPQLTAKGVEQAQRVAARAVREFPEVESIWVSCLERALGTAAAVHAALPSTSVVVMTDIHEVGGSYRYCHDVAGYVPEPGTTEAQVASKYPTFTFNSSFPNGWYSGSGKESVEVAQERAAALIARAEAYALGKAMSVPSPSTGEGDTQPSHPPPPCAAVAIITHGDFFRVLFEVLIRSGRVAVSDDIQRRILLKKPPPSASGSTDTPPGVTDTWVQNTSVTRFHLAVDEPHVALVAPSSTNTTQPSQGLRWEVEMLADATHLATI